MHHPRPNGTDASEDVDLTRNMMMLGLFSGFGIGTFLKYYENGKFLDLLSQKADQSYKKIITKPIQIPKFHFSNDPEQRIATLQQIKQVHPLSLRPRIELINLFLQENFSWDLQLVSLTDILNIIIFICSPFF